MSHSNPSSEPEDDQAASLPSLHAVFEPKTVAVIGATETHESVGRAVLWNLIRNPFGGTVLPVHPTRPNVLGIKAYPRVGAIPERVDLAVIATPAATVPDVIGECVDAGVRGAVVISAGFREVGPAGAELERRALAQARRGRLRLIGPNSLGVMRPQTGLNATLAVSQALPGSVGFLSQSGALSAAILDWSLKEHVGFSAFVSVGSMLDVGWGDLIDYLGDDPSTKCIVIYMESIGDARSFLSAAREVALAKPIIVIKSGRTEAAAIAAASHTGGAADSDEVLDAAFRRVGVLRVDRLSEVFHIAEVLAKQPRPKGPRLAVVTNAGGTGVVATDALVRGGGVPAALDSATIAELNTFLPEHWSGGNPVDVLGDADAERFARAAEVVSRDPNVDGLLVVLTPMPFCDPTATADRLRPLARVEGKPVLACWMGGETTAAGVAILNRAGIPTYDYPDTAARVFDTLWRSTYNLRGLYETPNSTGEDDQGEAPRAVARALLEEVRGSGRTLLTEAESKRLLQSQGIPTVTTRVALTALQAAEIAEEIGFPVVLKVHSETVTHKTEVGGVQLNLPDPEAVRRAFQEVEHSVAARAGPGHFLGVTVQSMARLGADGYELIIGGRVDPQFGPVLLFGTGGQLVEVFQDRALGLPPLNTTLARRMMEQTRIYSALKGVRGRPPVDLSALERLLVRFSRLIVEQPWILEIDINPLLASSSGLLALDARVILQGPEMTEDRLPRPAIRPYPTRYVGRWTARDGREVLIRPIRPEDEPLLVTFHGTLSERSVSFRYFHAMKLSARVSHERLTRMCFIDYDREMALVAEARDPTTGGAELLGVGRLAKRFPAPEAEFALLVSDQAQGIGLGTELLSRLIAVGRVENLARITGEILSENIEMRRVSARLGFRLSQAPGEPIVRAVLDLTTPNP